VFDVVTGKLAVVGGMVMDMLSAEEAGVVGQFNGSPMVWT
jgi:hypothetical protein